eukprot:TRINITY_DN548_c5_g1_i1.p1 TRINITY_DN548_c5_g1~~TRINITY_DN548_c5_g1_i1.p1  ORF type:complete len:338 (+),score=43.98 TRINITY_DN548_c5_g1_i1:44-1057(+)
MQRKPPPVLLATASYDRTIRFWEAPSGICMRTLNFQDSQVNCMCISPDRAYLAAGGHKHIRLYDLSATLQVPASTIESHTGNITSLVYLKDGKYLLSASEDGMIKIWDTRTMAMKKKFDVKASVNAMALCPDQCTIISGDQMGRVSLWNSRTQDEPFELSPAGDVGIRTVAASQQPGGLICAANNSGEVFAMKMVEVESTDADAAENSSDETHKKYKLVLMHTFKAHNKYILKCALSPDAKLLATCSADYTVGLWHTSECDPPNKAWDCYKSLQGHFRWVWDCAFSGDGKHLVTASSDNSGKLWDIEKGVDLVCFNCHHKPVTCIVIDDRAEVFSGG